MARLRTTVCSWKPCCIAIAPASRGAIFLTVSETGKTCIDVCVAGVKAVSSKGFFRHLAVDHDNEYMMIDSTIVRAHQHSAGALKKGTRIRLTRRTDHKDPCHLRCPGQSGGDRHHTGVGCGYQPGGTDAPKHRSGRSPRRQGV